MFRVCCLFIFAAVLTVDVASAGRPVRGSTLSFHMVADSNGDGLPNWGDSITLTYITSYPYTLWSSLLCYQNGVLVYSASTGYAEDYPWPWTRVMNLSSRSWTGGPANCIADLHYVTGKQFRSISIATLEFVVGE